MKSKKIKLAAGILVIVAAIAYLVFSSISSASAAYSISVEDAQSGKAEPGKYYRIEGKLDVSKATFDGNKTPVELKFDLYSENDPNKKIQVVYNDVKPDNFAEATAAMVQGKFNSDGSFKANQLLLKCPSKYEQAAEESSWTKFLKGLGIKK